MPPVVVYGTEAEVRGSLTLAGAAAPAGTAAAVSRRRVDEADFVPVETVTTDAAGRFVRKPEPRGEHDLPDRLRRRRHVDAPAASEIERPRAAALTTRFPKSFWLGDDGRFRGRVAPAHPGAKVTIERKVDGRLAGLRHGHAQRRVALHDALEADQPGLQVLPA